MALPIFRDRDVHGGHPPPPKRATRPPPVSAAARKSVSGEPTAAIHFRINKYGVNRRASHPSQRRSSERQARSSKKFRTVGDQQKVIRLRQWRTQLTRAWNGYVPVFSLKQASMKAYRSRNSAERSSFFRHRQSHVEQRRDEKRAEQD
jgi:hypothetical protein